MAKIIQPGEQNKPPQDRQQLESRFKRALDGLGSAFELPPTPEPPANLFTKDSEGQVTPEDRRAIWELQQDVKVLKERYNLAVKVVWRTSAALMGLAAPLIGSDLLSKLISLLGR
jgi:hypothetical protein